MHVNHITYMLYVGTSGNGCLYSHGAGCDHDQKGPYVLKYTQSIHTWDKLRHLKPVCVTKFRVVGSRYSHYSLDCSKVIIICVYNNIMLGETINK